MTYIDIREVWVEAEFRENSLENVAIGDPVEIVFDILPGRVVEGRVAALGYGVGNRSVDPRTGLPSPRSQSGWIRPAQLMPVRIDFDLAVLSLRVGSARKRVGEGKSVSVRVDIGGRRILKKKKHKK